MCVCVCVFTDGLLNQDLKRLNIAQQDIKAIQRQFKQFDKSINIFLKPPNHGDIVKILKHFPITSVADYFLLGLYLVTITPIIVNACFYPNGARSLLIFWLAALNICGYFLIELKLKASDESTNNDIAVIHGHRARRWTFLVIIFLATFIPFGQINFVVAICFYAFGGVLILIDLGYHIKLSKEIFNQKQSKEKVNAAKLAKKRRKGTDDAFNKKLKSAGKIGFIKQKNDDVDIKNDDDKNSHLEIAIETSVPQM